MPLGQINLPITFVDPTNYRMETLTFVVVGFHGAYHVIDQVMKESSCHNTKMATYCREVR